MILHIVMAIEQLTQRPILVICISTPAEPAYVGKRHIA